MPAPTLWVSAQNPIQGSGALPHDRPVQRVRRIRFCNSAARRYFLRSPKARRSWRARLSVDGRSSNGTLPPL